MSEIYQDQVSQQPSSSISASYSIELTRLNNLREYHSRIPVNIHDQYLIQGQNDSLNTSKSSQSDLMATIGSQIHKILQIQQQLYHFRTECFKLMQENDKLKQKEADFQRNLLQSKAALKKQRQISDTISVQLQRKIKESEELRKQIAVLPQQRLYFNAENDQIRKQKQIIIELTIKNENIIKINQFLQSQLVIAQRKLVQLQRDVQTHLCLSLSEDIARFKQNENYINKDLVIEIPSFAPSLKRNDSSLYKKNQVDNNFIQIECIDSYRGRKELKTLQDKTYQFNQNNKQKSLKFHRLANKTNYLKNCPLN